MGVNASTKACTAKNFRLSHKDLAAIATVRKRYGFNSDVAAVRFALNEEAKRIRKAELPAANPARKPKGG